jgi:serine phosphatase RsbU (regulator of sigma subunit)
MNSASMHETSDFPVSASTARAESWFASCREAQRLLVPRVVYRDARLEAYGESVAVEELGGDLVDVGQACGCSVAYIADVSGHGLRAGVLMAMVKAVLRYGLQAGQPLTEVLQTLGAIMPGLSDANMFATFAALRFDDSDEVEYMSAGHVPLLHYRRRLGVVMTYSMPQLPLGLFAGHSYASRRLRYEPGDLFALVSDGVAEAGAQEEGEFGMERLADILSAQAGWPLCEIAGAVRRALREVARQHDDESILLIRGRPLDASGGNWDMLLRRLAMELTLQ